MDLTGTPESTACSAFMFADSHQDNSNQVLSPAGSEAEMERGLNEPQTDRRCGSVAGVVLINLVFLLWCVHASSGQEVSTNTAVSQITSNSFFMAPLSVADAINLALQRNANVLRAQKDLEASQGIAVQTRALALPAVGFAGSYGAVQQTDIDIFRLPTLTFGTPQNWSSQFKLVQSFYQGGRILSSFRIARLTQQRSALDYQTVVADTVLSVQLAYYGILLAAQQITVREA